MTAMQVIETGYRPHAYQLQAHEELKRFNVICAHRRWGKTTLACNLLLNAALTTDNGLFLYVAPFLKQARAIAWDLLQAHAGKVPGVEFNRSEGAVKFPNGSKIVMAGSDNDQAIRGLGISGCVGDEVAQFRKETWPEVIRPALAADSQGRKGWFLAIGTPAGMDSFHEMYQNAVTSDDWYAGMYRADETDLPWLTEDELEQSKNIMSDAQYRQEWLCDFTASADNTLITIDMVSAAAKRHHHEVDLKGLPKVMGIDVARFGADRSCIIKRHGLKAFDMMVLKDVDNMHLASVIAQEINEWRPDAVFVDGGRGEGVIDRLRQIGHAVIEVQFGSRPTNPRYTNKRTEIWDKMAIWLREGGEVPNDPDLKSDLCTPTYSFDAANRMKLESKDKITERGMKSPDLADALACTFAMDVIASDQLRQGKPNIITDHVDYLEN